MAAGATLSASRDEEHVRMSDVVYLGVGLVAFALMALYALACDRL